MPILSPRSGRLFVATLDPRSEIEIEEWLHAQRLCPHRTGDGLFSVSVSEATVDEFCNALPFITSDRELEEVRLMIRTHDGLDLSHRELLRMAPAKRFIAVHRAQWLVQMLREERIINVYQPLVDPLTGSIRAYECLMRGVTDDGLVKMPMEMLATAKDSGLLFHLDQAARVMALRNATALSLDGMVFINFNPTTVCQPHACLRATLEAVAETQIDPSRIVFEVTESESVADPAHLAKVLQLYREEGFRIALDDLGAGYSSLNLLTDLRPDFVKLDMKLIRHIDKDSYKQHVTRALLDMARCLEIQTVVEGVESKGEWDWVAQHGANLIQGYYFARPSEVPPQSTDNPHWQPYQATVRLSA